MIIGEAAAAVTPECKAKYTQFDWRLMKGMRNIIVHEYFGVDVYSVWQTVVNDIPKLLKDCKAVLEEI